MTSEIDFRMALDEAPADWQTRLVFADFLQERNDPRADGYRVLGFMRRYPYRQRREDWTWHGSRTATPDEHKLPDDWFHELSNSHNLDAWPQMKNALPRCQVEDAAALAFARLLPERRAELLAQAQNYDIVSQ